jgi:hypothetical protein
MHQLFFLVAVLPVLIVQLSPPETARIAPQIGGILDIALLVIAADRRRAAAGASQRAGGTVSRADVAAPPSSWPARSTGRLRAACSFRPM